jgi:hypothetical protein
MADGLHVMLALVYHLVAVDGGDVRIPLTSHLGVDVSVLLHQIRTRLGEGQSPLLHVSVLTSLGHQAAPASEALLQGEALHLADEEEVDCRAILAYAFDALQVAEGCSRR